MNRLMDVVIDIAIGYVAIKVGTKCIKAYGDTREIIGIVEGALVATAAKGGNDNGRTSEEANK